VSAEKKLASIAVHLSETRKVQITRMAERAGLTNSEFIHGLIEKHIQDQINEARLILEFLNVEGSVSSESSLSTGMQVVR